MDFSFLFFFLFYSQTQTDVEEKPRRGSFSAFCARRGELLSNPAALASGNQLLAHRPDTHKHTLTHTYTQCVGQIKAWQPAQTPTAAWNMSPGLHATPLFLLLPQHFSPSLKFSLISHPLTLYIPCPQNSISLSPPFFSPSLSACISLSIPVKYVQLDLASSSSALSSQTQERKRSSWFYTARGRDGWMDGGAGIRR